MPARIPVPPERHWSQRSDYSAVPRPAGRGRDRHGWRECGFCRSKNLPKLPRSALLRSAVEPTRDYPAAYKATAINHYATLAFNWWAVLDLNQYSSG